MNDLPSRTKVEALYKNQGKDAVIWYAWRNSVRTLYALGELDLKEIWPQHTVKHLFAVIRANIEVYNCLIGYGKKDKSYLLDFFDAAQDAADEAHCLSYVAQSAASLAHAYTSEDFFISDVMETIEACKDAAISYAKKDLDDIRTAKGNELVYMHLDPNADIRTNNVYYLNDCMADFKYLCDSLAPKNIQEVGLWRDGLPERIVAYEKSFHENLVALDLDDIAYDVKKLWQGELAVNKMQSYSDSVSQIQLETARDIKRLIHESDSFETYNAVRVMIVGPGGAGKSSLAELIRTGKIENKTIGSTIGIDYYDHKEVHLLAHSCLQENHSTDELKKVALYLWDFGGQAIFHNLHNAFMHENCVYVLVVDSRHEQAPEQWLHQIAEITNNRGKVMLVTNWFEEIYSRQNRTALIRKFPRLLSEDSFFDFSCHDANSADFSTFMKQLVKYAEESRKRITKELKQAIDLVDDTYNNDKFITKSHLRLLLKQRFDSEQTDINELFGWLEEFGRFVSVDNLDEELCLKPEWVIGKAYKLLYDSRVRLQRGIVTGDEIIDITQDNSTEAAAAEGRKILEFVQQQQVCIQLNDNQKPQRYFLPDAAPMDEPIDLQSILAQKSFITFYELTHLPVNLRAKLVHDFANHQQITVSSEKEVWRDGIIVRLKHSNACGVLEYQYPKQRVQLTMVGENKDRDTLYDIIDAELEKVAHITLKGISLNTQPSVYSRHECASNLPPSAQFMTSKSGLVKDFLQFIEQSGEYEENVENDNPIMLSSAEKQAMYEVLTVLKVSFAKDKVNREKLPLLELVESELDKSGAQLPNSNYSSANMFITRLWKMLQVE